MADSKINKSFSSGRKKKPSAVFSTFLQSYLFGDLWWARFRSIFLVLLVGSVSAVMAFGFEEVTRLRVWHNIFFPLLIISFVIFLGALILRDIYEASRKDSMMLVYLAILIILISFSLQVEYKYVVIGLTGPSISRYLIMPLAALFCAFLASARYFQDIYNLDNYGLAALYLMASFGGIAYPKIKISEGQKQIEAGKKNRLDLIGGPGYITIRPGNVILTERLHGPAGVYSAGNFFASRFESIAISLNLDDQHGHVPSVSATTKDGITVTVRDVHFRYRVWSGYRVTNTTAGRSQRNPYPYTVQAIRNMAYNRTVSADGLAPWHDAVKGAIVGSITEYISKHQLDQITAPRYVEGDPRKEIGIQLKTPEVRDKLKDAGAQLLWCDIGHFEVENKAVSEQRIDTWKAGWVGNANVKRAYGEAQRIAYQEIGHAEAQAEILMSIIHAFDDIDMEKEKKDRNIRNVILMRTAQVLEALALTTEKEKSSGKDTKKEGKQS
ncbi:MAG: hypothetical protein IH589_17880 [Anaerolineales bacterium]|nr:hypothetical protein [Anaerolineales bacterium]